MFYLTSVIEDKPHHLSDQSFRQPVASSEHAVSTCNAQYQGELPRQILALLKPHFSFAQMIKRSIQEDSMLPDGARVKTLKKVRKEAVDSTVGEHSFSNYCNEVLQLYHRQHWLTVCTPLLQAEQREWWPNRAPSKYRANLDGTDYGFKIVSCRTARKSHRQ